MRVKFGDTHEVSWRANADLTGAAVRLTAQASERPAVDLSASIKDAAGGMVSHRLTGFLPVGTYRIELEVIRDGVTTTFPNAGYAELTVWPDLD